MQCVCRGVHRNCEKGEKAFRQRNKRGQWNTRDKKVEETTLSREKPDIRDMGVGHHYETHLFVKQKKLKEKEKDD